MNEDSGFSIINSFVKFAELGAEWVMWVMIALGLIMFAIMVERLRLFLSTKIDAPDVARRLVNHLDAGDIDGAKKLVSRGLAMEERVLADILESYDRGPHVVEQIMLSSMAREKQRFNRFLSYFGTLGNNAPFIGLFGTVIGIILAFVQLGRNPKGGLEVIGPAIAEALVATALGLLVAIPAVVLYNWLKGMVKERVSNTDFLGRIVLAELNRDDDRALVQKGA